MNLTQITQNYDTLSPLQMEQFLGFVLITLNVAR